MIPHPPINIRSEGQGHKVQKGDQMSGVSYALECPASSSF